MGHNIPKQLCTMFRDYYNLETFVETGTYKAQTSIWAAGEFKNVITIEGYKPRWEKARAHVAAQHPEIINIDFVYGDSRHMLRRVLQQIQAPALLWLDAHWCGEGAQDSHEIGDECPLRQELEAVNLHTYSSDMFILIDDARLFTAPPPYPHDPQQWPTWGEVKRLLERCPRYVHVHDDVIIAVPPHAQRVVEKYVQLTGAVK